MDALAIKEFISIYQYVIFSQLREIFGSLEPPEKEDFPDIMIQYKRLLPVGKDKGEFFPELVKNSNLADVIQVLNHFYFIKPLYLENMYVLFGRDDNGGFYIGVDLSNRKVILAEDIDGAYTYIASGEGGFLNYLRIYLEYRILPNKLTNDFEVNRIFKEKVIAAVGGNEYADYYRFVFPCQSDSEFKPIALPFRL